MAEALQGRSQESGSIISCCFFFYLGVLVLGWYYLVLWSLCLVFRLAPHGVSYTLPTWFIRFYGPTAAGCSRGPTSLASMVLVLGSVCFATRYVAFFLP
ncbi:hypothetical protein C8Q75DRAFT_770318 [Abortiporus biennis]|nr:hypothetical protein C8Q75DRAFT_770318 [Abortiporus biennis]